MMTIGIICAMDEEIELLTQDMQSEQVQTIAGRNFYIGTLYGKQTVLVKSHIGKVAAALTASLLIDHFCVGSIIFSGTAGGIDPTLHVGDAVIGDLTCQHDFKVPGDPLFQIPVLKKSYLESDCTLTQLAFEAVNDYIQHEMLLDIPEKHLKAFHIQTPKAVIGTIASGDEFICDKERNQWLYEHVQNIKCVEMEGAAVAQVCYEFQIPFAIIRIISDGANDDTHVDFDLFIEEAARYFTKGAIKTLLNKLS